MSDPRIIPASEAKRLRENTKNIGTWRVEHDDMEDQWDITWERHFSDFSATMQIGHAHGEGTARMFAAAPDLAHTVLAQAEQIKTLSSLLAGAEKAAIDRSEQIKRLQAAVGELLPEYNRLDMAEQLVEEPHESPHETTYTDLGLEHDDITPQDMETPNGRD